MLGAPFSANLQNFPLIPSRLLLLLLDPAVAYGVGVALAAALAAVFAYLYCRRIGLSEIGAVTAGWTFACAGFFATRVAAGHLPLLEAYPSLPLLLWLADRAVSPDRTQYQARDLVALAFASACVAVAGHPQVPVYSLATALLYILVRGRGWRRARVVSAMTLGLGTTLFAWWPMLLLVRRSTRVLALAAPTNDIVMPYHRLLALIRPGIDGWPDIVASSNQHPFGGYPNYAYFWDTASYIGLLPLLVILLLLFRSAATQRLPRWPWAFLAALGLGAFLLALPLADPLHRMIPGTLLRSPARLLYLSTFSAAIALGVGVDEFLQSNLLKLRARQAVVACCLIFHLLDLGGFSRQFIHTDDSPIAKPEFEQILSREVGGGRIAIDPDLKSMSSDRYDDVGVFDSLLLANPYRAILALNGSPRDLNVQDLAGSELAIPALQGAGVRFVVTSAERQDLKVVSETDAAYLYRVPDPAPRAAFFAESSTDFMPQPEILEAFVSHPRSGRLLLPADARRYIPTGDGQADVAYARPSSDEIRLRPSTDQAGFVQVLESYDPGWSATVDGVRAPVILANGFSMAVPVAAGKHEVRLLYETPGRTAGFVLSLISACMLAGLVAQVSRPVSASLRIIAFICLCVPALDAAGPPKPLWSGSRYTVEDRDRAVKRGLQFIYHVASDPKTFHDWGHDLLWCFYSISATAKNPKVREMAHDMGHERALKWRLDHPQPPTDDSGELSDFVFGTDAANRLGVPDGPVVREQVRRAAARFTAEDFLDFDPSREPPPSDVPNSCPNPKCGYQNRRGATKCEKCNTALTFESRYEVWLDALISTYTGDVYGVNLGASYDDVLRWIDVMRPYAPREKAGPEEAGHIVYAITHVIYTLNDYGRYRLSRAWLPLEFNYLKANLTEWARANDPETVGEFMDTLRAFGMSERDPLIRIGIGYQLSHQNPDGSWGNINAESVYTRYHSTWTAVDGLREYQFQGERLRRQELMALITPHRNTKKLK